MRERMEHMEEKLDGMERLEGKLDALLDMNGGVQSYYKKQGVKI